MYVSATLTLECLKQSQPNMLYALQSPEMNNVVLKTHLRTEWEGTTYKNNGK